MINNYIKSFFEKKDKFNILEPITTLLKICLILQYTLFLNFSLHIPKCILYKYLIYYIYTIHMKYSRASIGKYKVLHKEKYVADLREVTYRSSWERKYMDY